MGYPSTWCWALCALLAFPAAAAGDPIMSPTQLNANAAKYDRQQVTVRGYAILQTHQHSLHDSKELEEELHRRVVNHTFTDEDNRYCLTIINPQALSKTPWKWMGLTHHTLTVRGEFIANYMNENIVNLAACEFPTGLFIEKVISIK